MRSEIERFAIEHEITFGRLKDDLDGAQGGRTLYLVDGDPSVAAREWLDGGYDDFTQSLTTQVRPFNEAGDRDPTGAYAVFGDYDKAVELADFLSFQGLTVTRQFDRWSLNPKDLFVQDSQVIALSMMVLVSVAVAAAGVLVGARAYGVNRLHGLGFGSLLLHDMRTLAVYWLSAGCLVVGAAVSVLAAYNGLANIGLYLLTALVISCVLTVATIAAHALVLLLLMQLRVLSAVKGQLPGRTASAVAYTLRMVTVIATVALTQQAISAGLDVERRGETLATYERLGGISKITISNVWSSEDRERFREDVGAWLRREDQAGHLLLAGQQYIEYPGAASGKPLLYVNDNFLRNQTIRLATGTVFAGGEAKGPTVLLPPDLWNQRDEILKKVLPIPGLHSDNGAPVDFGVAESAGGQKIFTYTSEQSGPRSRGNPDGDQSFVTDPIVVFLPSERGLLSGHGYAAFASQGRALFPDPQVVSQAVAGDPVLDDLVVAVTPVADQYATERRAVLQEFRLALFSAFAGMLVLIITGVGTVLIHTRRNAQWIFARYVSGWRFTAVHRILLIFEAGVLAVLIGFLPYKAWTINNELAESRRMGMPASFKPMILGAPEWVAIGLLAVLTVSGILVTLIGIHRRVIRDGACEA